MERNRNLMPGSQPTHYINYMRNLMGDTHNSLRDMTQKCSASGTLELLEFVYDNRYTGLDNSLFGRYYTTKRTRVLLSHF